MVFWKPGINVAWITVLTNHNARVLNCFVWIKQFTADHRRARIFVGISLKRGQPAAPWNSVVVQEHEVITGGSDCTIVATLSETFVCLARDDFNFFSEAAQHLRRSIG